MIAGDEPFDGIAASVKPALLELLGRAAGSPQLGLLTDDEEIVSWARLAAMTGAVAVIDASATAPV